MAINYCDWLNGDDGTGDGTFGNPYKTITKASDSLTGGDEVRVAKSPADTDLSGTLDFVNDSNLINTSEDLTGELSPGDFIYKDGDEDDLMEVISIAITTITLYKEYRGTTETITAKKVNPINTGIASWDEYVQEIMSSGTSTVLRLKISGGWDLSTQIQDEKTFFRQEGTSKYGNGIFCIGKNYVELEKLGFLRYYCGIQLNVNVTYCKLNYVYGYGNSENNIYLYTASNNIIENFICNYGKYGINIIQNSENNIISYGICKNNTEGIYIRVSNNNINNVTCNYNSSYGIYIYTSIFNTILYNVTCNYNTNGILISTASNNNIINTAICNYNTSRGINIDGYNNIINNVTCSYNSSNGFLFENSSEYNELHTVICNNNGGNGIQINSKDNIITNLTCNNNNTGIYLYYGYFPENIVNNYSAEGNMNDISVYPFDYVSEDPLLKIQHFKNEGDNRCYYVYGITYRDTAEAQSDQCLRFESTSNDHYMLQKFNFPILQNTPKNISFYIKDDVAFDGDVQAALFFLGMNITGWTAISTTEDYLKHTLVAQSVNITEDGVLELRIKVRGTAGNVYVDDLGAK